MHSAASTASGTCTAPIYIPADAFIHQRPPEYADQVVPSQQPQTPSPINYASEVEVSTTSVAVHYEDEQHQPVTVMEIPVTTIDPKGLGGRGCSKVVVETVKSIPMDGTSQVTATSATTSEAGGYELISPEGIKEIDFTMF